MYELYCKFRDKKGYKDADVSKATGIPASTFTDWKNGRSKPNTEKLLKIADALDTLVEYLSEPKSSLITCPDCGLTYDSKLANDMKEHSKEHLAWQKATEKFGELYCVHAINEKIKAKNRAISHDLSQSLETRYNAQLKVLRCLFSRSVMASGYDLEHRPFDKYVAMMMYNESYRKHYDNELCKKLIDNYGTMPGIKDGDSIYYIPSKTISITPKDKRDIGKDIESIMEKLAAKEYGPAAYNGEELSEESATLFQKELEIALERLKLINKEKYNPLKNKK